MVSRPLAQVMKFLVFLLVILVVVMWSASLFRSTAGEQMNIWVELALSLPRKCCLSQHSSVISVNVETSGGSRAHTLDGSSCPASNMLLSCGSVSAFTSADEGVSACLICAGCG